MQIIKTWLTGKQNFAVGAIMYRTIGKDQSLKDIFSKGETAASKKLLIQAFERMLQPEQEQPTIPAEAKPDDSEVMPDSFDEVLQSLKTKWTEPYQRMNYLRHQLDKDFDDVNSIEAINYRKSIAFAILQLEQECIKVWKERDYYLKHGKLPNVPETKTFVIPSDPVELANLINSIKKNIRRNRKQLQDNPGDAKYAQLLADYRLKFKQITGKDYDEKDPI